MMSFEQVIAALDRAVQPLAPARLDLASASGLRLAAPATADVDAPPGDVSAMDGYAARAEDIASQKELEVVLEIPAGSAPPPLPAGAAARIFTGALLPEGADTVVPQEQAVQARDGAGQARGSVVLEPLRRGSHVRRQGEIFSTGQSLVKPGHRLTPTRVALLAAGGCHQVSAYPRPRLAVIQTGSELVETSALPGPGQIRDSNGPMLEALCSQEGLQAPLHLAARDTAADLRTTLGNAADATDLVVTTGGVSVGDYDLVPDTIQELGGEILLHRARIKPGKPILAARLAGAWILGLPGNPVSVLACWRLFGRPLVRRLGGDLNAYSETPIRARLERGTVNAGGRTFFRPGLLWRGSANESGSSSYVARVVDWQGSHDLVAAGRANALLRLDPKRELDAGSTVACYALDSEPVADGCPARRGSE